MSGANSPDPARMEDIAGYLRSCAEALEQSAEIFKTIEKEVPEFVRLRTLAGAGLWISSDVGNLARAWSEEVRHGE